MNYLKCSNNFAAHCICQVLIFRFYSVNNKHERIKIGSRTRENVPPWSSGWHAATNLSAESRGAGSVPVRPGRYMSLCVVFCYFDEDL